MTGPVNVDRITKENWETAWTARCHAGIWMGARVDRDENGFFGVCGKPGTFGFIVRCDSLEDALAWVNQEPAPFAIVEIGHTSSRPPRSAARFDKPAGE